MLLLISGPFLALQKLPPVCLDVTACAYRLALSVFYEQHYHTPSCPTADRLEPSLDFAKEPSNAPRYHKFLHNLGPFFGSAEVHFHMPRRRMPLLMFSRFLALQKHPPICSDVPCSKACSECSLSYPLFCLCLFCLLSLIFIFILFTISVIFILFIAFQLG